MWFGLISLFPELYKPFSELGVFGRSVESNLIALDMVNPRDFATDRHRTVDDRPYGGGPGMLMKVQPLKDALSEAKQLASKQGVEASRVVYLSPQGKRFDDETARSLAQEQGLILIAGRYEGVDERFIQDSVDMELSIGDFVLSGGELASMVVMDAVARHIDGVLGHSESAERDSFAEGLLDCPHYTRPEVLNGRSVPEVLLSGDHEKIRKWRLQQALARTYERRPDLLERKELSQEQRLLLDEYLKDVNR